VRASSAVGSRALPPPQGLGGSSPDGHGRTDGAPGGDTQGGRAPDGGGSPDRREHASG
jgi:hypothetical protein